MQTKDDSDPTRVKNATKIMIPKWWEKRV